VIEQITYLLFLRRLDDLHTLEENKANRLKKPMERRIFPEGKDSKGWSYEDYRWSRFKHFAPAEMYTLVGEHLFPFLRADLARQLGNGDSTYAHHMKDARFTIPTPALLAKVVDLLDHVPMEDRDTKGDVYEYMLGKIATAGQNGQFRTPRHIIRLMVELTGPQPNDVICDPACGTAGFLVAAGEYLRERHPNLLHDPKLREHFHHGMFHGFDFDNTMLRIGSMNMLLHGVENPDIRYRDSLAQDHAGEEEKYTLVLANPPFAGSLDYENTAKDLLQIVKTKKTELLFLALFLRLMKPGGRAAVIVPDGVLFGSSKAHKELRRILVEDQKLDAVVSLPGGVFKPYAGVSTAILFFTKTNSGGTDVVWFYDVEADGWSLDDKRTPLLSEDKLGPVPSFLRHSRESGNPVSLSDDEHMKNNLPDVLVRWIQRAGSERDRPRTAQSFCVPKADIAAQGYDLSLNCRYDLRRPCILCPTLPGLFTGLVRELDALSITDQNIGKRLRDFKEAVQDLRLGPTEGRVSNCVMKQVMFLEAVAAASGQVSGSDLAALCNRLEHWPHPAVKKSLLSLYGFASDFPGVRHGTPSTGMKRDIDMRDMVAMSILLTGFTPYLENRLNAEAIFGGSANHVGPVAPAAALAAASVGAQVAVARPAAFVVGLHQSGDVSDEPVHLSPARMGGGVRSRRKGGRRRACRSTNGLLLRPSCAGAGGGLGLQT
jgi:type I restriction enzyme M protein